MANCYHKSWSPSSAVRTHETWGGSIVMWLPLYRWLVGCLENPRKMDDLGVLMGTLILGNFHIYAAMRCDFIEVYFWNGRSTEIWQINWNKVHYLKSKSCHQRIWDAKILNLFRKALTGSKIVIEHLDGKRPKRDHCWGSPWRGQEAYFVAHDVSRILPLLIIYRYL